MKCFWLVCSWMDMCCGTQWRARIVVADAESPAGYKPVGWCDGGYRDAKWQAEEDGKVSGLPRWEP